MKIKKKLVFKERIGNMLIDMNFILFSLSIILLSKTFLIIAVIVSSINLILYDIFS